jgi:hypothetical protein
LIEEGTAATRYSPVNSIVWGNTPTASSLSTVDVVFNPANMNFASEGDGYLRQIEYA